MNNIFSKFNLYDQIGYLMVGGVAFLVLEFNVLFFFSSAVPYLQNQDNFWALVVITYFLGHLVQSIANLINKLPFINALIKENKQEFSDSEKEILTRVKKYFSLFKADENKAWSLCYMFGIVKDITGQVQSFNSYYSLYRGWLVLFLLESLFLVYRLVFFFTLPTLGIFLISVFFVFTFYLRSKRFWQYVRNKAFQTFVLIEKLKL